MQKPTFIPHKTFPVYMIPWISQSRCLTPISACDPAYVWLQSRQDPLQGSTASCGAQVTAEHRALISPHLQLLSGYPDVPYWISCRECTVCLFMIPRIYTSLQESLSFCNIFW
jgi:hypothetical protein